MLNVPYDNGEDLPTIQFLSIRFNFKSSQLSKKKLWFERKKEKRSILEGLEGEM